MQIDIVNKNSESCESATESKTFHFINQAKPSQWRPEHKENVLVCYKYGRDLKPKGHHSVNSLRGK